MDLDDIIDRYARTPAERERDDFDQVKARLIREAISTPESRRKLAEAMSPRRNPVLDLFPVQELPAGALPIYDKDPDFRELVVGESDEG